jgi:hypothetical protein
MVEGDVPDEQYRTRKPRTIVQIAAAQHQQIDQVYRVEHVEVQLFALCDDGTLWARRTGSEEWKQPPNVPQP